MPAISSRMTYGICIAYCAYCIRNNRQKNGRRGSKAKIEVDSKKQNGRYRQRHKEERAGKKREGKKSKKGDKKGRGERLYESQTLVHTDTQSCPGGTMLVTWVPKKGAHHDDDGHTQSSVCWADRLLPPVPGIG